MGISAAAAVTHWSGLMLTMAALVVVGRVSSQAGLVVYPITNGLVIPMAVVLGALILKQKTSIPQRDGSRFGHGRHGVTVFLVKESIGERPRLRFAPASPLQSPAREELITRRWT